jgi:hypothetical protein
MVGVSIKRKLLCLSVVTLIAVFAISTQYVGSVSACYGPHITADIVRTQVNVNESVTCTG